MSNALPPFSPNPSNDADRLPACVVGFAFNARASRIVLINKKRPDWQAGRLNAPGGKVKPGEDFFDAMVREFREETGVETLRQQWDIFGLINNPEGAEIWLFRCFSKKCMGAATQTDEPIVILPVGNRQISQQGVGDLPYLLTQARQRGEGDLRIVCPAREERPRTGNQPSPTPCP